MTMEEAAQAMVLSHRLRDADSGEWLEAVNRLKGLGYMEVSGLRDRSSNERRLALHHACLPAIDILLIDGEPWRVTVR